VIGWISAFVLLAANLLPINRQYYDLAASTGGDFYFWAPGEFAAARLQVPIHGQAVLLSYGDFDSKKTFEIPVESGVKELTLFAGSQRKDLAVLLRPDGTVARDRDAGVRVQSFQHMLIATVASPSAGMWRLEVDGAGAYAVTAHVRAAETAPELDRFEFVEPGGGPGHEGMFPLKRSPGAGETLSFRLVTSGSVREVEFGFVTRDGSRIHTIPMTMTTDGEYSGRCKVPGVPFRALIQGIDGNGARFQRIESPLRAPE
jgi:hypothetical protein